MDTWSTALTNIWEFIKGIYTIPPWNYVMIPATIILGILSLIKFIDWLNNRH